MSEVRLPAPVRAIRVDSMGQSGPAGAFKLFREDGPRVAGLIYRCPCGCGALAPLYFKPAESPSWNWDGNENAPTLSPSVHHVGHWHGYLREGFWVNSDG